MPKKKIDKPIWGLVNGSGELVFWAEEEKDCLDNKWAPDEKLVPLKITERKK